MRRYCYRTTCAALLLVFSAASVSSAKDVRETKLLEIARRLSAVSHPSDVAWPPAMQIDNRRVDVGIRWQGTGTRRRAVLQIPALLFDDNDPRSEDAAALQIGQAVAHVLLLHDPRPGRAFGDLDCGAEQQQTALRLAAKTMLGAGFSLKTARRSLTGRPGWRERFTELQTRQAELARSMSAFTAGTTLLAIERYELAELCFQRVVKELIGSGESWRALGYCRLMRYFERLTLEDLDDFGVGVVLTGTDFPAQRGDGRIVVRGIDRKLWWSAVDALHEGLRQDEDSVDALVALALAYMFHPEESDPAQALKLLQRALKAAEDSPASSGRRGAIWLNLAAVHFATAEAASAIKALAEVDKCKSADEPHLAAAVHYYRALQHTTKAKPDWWPAAMHFENFLASYPPDSLWWKRSYEQYRIACAKLDQRPRTADELRRESPRIP